MDLKCEFVGPEEVGAPLATRTVVIFRWSAHVYAGRALTHDDKRTLHLASRHGSGTDQQGAPGTRPGRDGGQQKQLTFVYGLFKNQCVWIVDGHVATVDYQI